MENKEKVLLSKIDNISFELSAFETANAEIFKKRNELINALETAKEDHKKYLLSQNNYLVGLLCTTPNGKRGEIVEVRISGKGSNVMCKVKLPSNYYRFETKEFTVDQLVIKKLPDVIRNIYRANKK